MLTEKTFKVGLAILSSCGLKIEEEHQIEAWWQLLKDLDEELFVESIIGICKEKEKWWPTDNVPATIRAKLKELKTAKWKEEQEEKHRLKMLDWQKNRSLPPKPDAS